MFDKLDFVEIKNFFALLRSYLVFKLYLYNYENT